MARNPPRHGGDSGSPHPESSFNLHRGSHRWIRDRHHGRRHLILGLDGDVLEGTTSKAAFIGGASLASLSWQLLLAGAGGLLHRRLTPRARLATAILGNLIVTGLALRLLLS